MPRVSYFVLFAEYYYDDQIEDDETGRACSTHGRDEKMCKDFLSKTVMGTDQFEVAI
jgi:hypothetical protein